MSKKTQENLMQKYCLCLEKCFEDMGHNDPPRPREDLVNLAILILSLERDEDLIQHMMLDLVNQFCSPKKFMLMAGIDGRDPHQLRVVLKEEQKQFHKSKKLKIKHTYPNENQQVPVAMNYPPVSADKISVNERLSMFMPLYPLFVDWVFSLKFTKVKRFQKKRKSHTSLRNL